MEEELGTDNFHIRRGRNYFYDKKLQSDNGLKQSAEFVRLCLDQIPNYFE